MLETCIKNLQTIYIYFFILRLNSAFWYPLQCTCQNSYLRRAILKENHCVADQIRINISCYWSFTVEVYMLWNGKVALVRSYLTLFLFTMAHCMDGHLLLLPKISCLTMLHCWEKTFLFCLPGGCSCWYSKVLLKIKRLADRAYDGISVDRMHFTICLISLDADNCWWHYWTGCSKSYQVRGVREDLL